jgi:hypothetical protein
LDVILVPASHHSNVLVCAYVCVKEIRARPRDLHSEYGTKRTSQQKYSNFAQAHAQILRNFYAIKIEPLHAEVGCTLRAGSGESLTCTPLVPLNKGKMLLPST